MTRNDLQVLKQKTSGAEMPAPESSTDAQLVEKALENDRNAFQQLYQRYHKLVRLSVWNFFRRQALVEEYCQDIFLKAYVKLPALKKRSAFKGWLMRIAYSFCVDAARRKKLTEAVRDETQTIELPIEAGAEGADTLKALNQLSALDGMIVWLHYVEQFSFPEMEDITGLKANNLRQRTFRALRRLRKELS